jgi:uncharacterized protein YecE (DUF72 family)
VSAGVVRVGTCSFADEALTRSWYPSSIKRGPERLAYYAARFDTVEIDSSFYGLPRRDSVASWADATPNGFVFHVKAFAPMTGHPVRLEQLPADLRDAVPLDVRGRIDRVPRDVRAEVFRRFRDTFEPLRSAGKLGGVLVQLPPYIVCRPEARDDLAWVAEQLAGDRLLVEFRHRSWLAEAERHATLGLLEELGATYVIVDAPHVESSSAMRTIIATTSDIAYVRLHGRNAATWNARGRGASERFDYLYTLDELEEWVEASRELSASTRATFVMFNNNNRSTVTGADDFPRLWVEDTDKCRVVAQAPTNAEMLRDLLERSGVRVSDPSR